MEKKKHKHKWTREVNDLIKLANIYGFKIISPKVWKTNKNHQDIVLLNTNWM